MTREEVLSTHTEVFYRALRNQDYDALAKTYSDNYMLVRPDGSVLNREQVLNDLQEQGLIFHSIELWHLEIRIYGSAAILTGESRTIASRNGNQTKGHASISCLCLRSRRSVESG